MKIKIDILNRQRKLKISKLRILRTSRKIFRKLYLNGNLENLRTYRVLSLSIILVSSKKMKEINYKFRGENYPTDILSFSMKEKFYFNEEFYIGEILINLEKAKYQSIQYGLSLWDELERLLVHGILHLLGYDHEGSPKEAKKMRALEEKILKSLKT